MLLYLVVFVDVFVVVFAVVFAICLCLFLLGPRPQLDPDAEKPAPLPIDRSPVALAEWLTQRERDADPIDGTGAHVVFANPACPERTPWVFLYLHGFSATWPETAPLTQSLANHYHSNVLQARIAGHGCGTEGMRVSAEHWFASVATQFNLASELGDKLVIVATSTGAPVSVWLAQRHPERIAALLHLSPNFRVRNPMARLLTWPWSQRWVSLVVGDYREWTPISEEQRRYWTTKQPTESLIEMQKVVDWIREQDLSRIRVPLATMYMPNDPTIDPTAAIAAHENWGADHKRLIRVAPDGDEVSHVFVGDICGPHRNTWCFEQFRAFLDEISNRQAGN